MKCRYKDEFDFIQYNGQNIDEFISKDHNNEEITASYYPKECDIYEELSDGSTIITTVKKGYYIVKNINSAIGTFETYSPKKFNELFIVCED